MTPRRSLICSVVAVLLVSCTKSPPDENRTAAQADSRSASALAPAIAAIPHGLNATGVTFVQAPETDVATAVLALRRATNAPVLVYVGAAWCEPCQRFHKAATSGALDAALGNLTLLEFDADRDADRLAQAGYRYTMIPLFARPDAAGVSSKQQLEGSIKGDGAVANIVPRLQLLLRDP